MHLIIMSLVVRLNTHLLVNITTASQDVIITYEIIVIIHLKILSDCI